MEDHSGHQLDDLENYYLKNVTFCKIEISKFKEYFLLTSQGLKNDIDDDAKEIKKKVMVGIRNSIKAEAESLKELVNRVTSEKLEQADKKESLLKA